jgi:hypothetical protein
MPTMQRLADNGLTYTQWHTTALYSPTRSCLLTGRNHHQNGSAQIARATPATFRGRMRRSARCCAKAPWKTQPGHFSLCGEGLSIGRDSGDSVSAEYTPHFPFTGGRIRQVEIGVGDDTYIDLERDFRAGLARD